MKPYEKKMKISTTRLDIIVPALSSTRFGAKGPTPPVKKIKRTETLHYLHTIPPRSTIPKKRVIPKNAGNWTKNPTYPPRAYY
tara:strand:+ start:4133 stop:4381 length:249 start_codon:yes stop_codon:yes gene_type:complete